MTELRELVIRIEGRPPTPNARRAWQLVARDNALWKRVAQSATEQQLPDGFGPPMDRAEIEVTFVVATRAVHDWDNLIASTKPLTDGIVAAGVLRDDSERVVARVAYPAIRYEQGLAATVYRIRELPSTERLGL